MGRFQDWREIKKLQKLDSRYKTKSGLMKNLPSILVFLVLFSIFFAHSIASNISSFTFKNVDDIIYKIDINEKITCPYTESDLNSALTKLNDVGLTSISTVNTYTLNKIKNNTATPTSNLVLTNAEYESIAIPIYYAMYGKSLTIHEIYFENQEDNSVKIKVISSFILKLSLQIININDRIYISTYYLLKDNTLELVDAEFLNINTDAIKKEDIKPSDEPTDNSEQNITTDENDTNEQNNSNDTNTDTGSITDEEDEILSFLNFMLIKNETEKNYFEYLNYSNYTIENGEITFIIWLFKNCHTIVAIIYVSLAQALRALVFGTSSQLLLIA